jgi:hypothetical protein
MQGPWNSMANLLDESIKEKYRQYFVNDPLKFMKDAIDWNAFPPLLEDLYRNNTDKGGAPNIPIVIIVKVLFLQSIYNTNDLLCMKIERPRFNKCLCMYLYILQHIIYSNNVHGWNAP